MNPNPPSPAPGDSMPDHDALEVQVTALLLGELPAAEAAQLRARSTNAPNRVGRFAAFAALGLVLTALVRFTRPTAKV